MSEPRPTEPRPAGRPGDRLGAFLRRMAPLSGEPAGRAGLEALAADLDREPDGGTPGLPQLSAAFGLSPFERDLLALVGLPEEHEDLTRFARLLHPRGEPRMCLATLAAVLNLDASGRRHLREALDAGPLSEHRLVLADRTGPLPEEALRLPAGLWSAVRGHDHWPAGLRPLPVPPMHSPALDGPVLGRAVGAGRRVVVVSGAGRPATELAALVRGAAVAAGIRVAVLPAETGTGEAGALLSVHAAVRGAAPVLVGRPSSPPLPTHPGPVVVCADDPAGLPLDERPAVRLELGERGLAEDLGMWRALLPELDGGVQRLAGVLRVDPVRARRAVADSRASTAAGTAALTVAGVVAAARRRTDGDLPAGGRIVRPCAGWDRLVTTPENTDLLRSLVDRVRGQVCVLSDWGFGSRAGRGVRGLFAGPPGTGKTLSAHVVAAALDLDLLVVDMASLVSKWLGETEKNISEVFAAAQRSQAVLFFDEADALFGKRTDGSDAQARWANLETAHLLGRIDAFDGLVVLASNLRANIDEAFVRRLDVVVEFDEPGPAERLRLWATHLPPAAPLGEDVDLGGLAAVYQLTGGSIRNAVLSAAFRAAATNGVITQHLLLDAVEREYRKAGRCFPGFPRNTAGTRTGGS